MQGNMKVNRFLAVLFAFGCTLSITGCGGDKSRAIEETRRHLKDPDSAKFGEVVIVDMNEKDGRGNHMRTACVTVNAKNSYGGYNGDKQAMLLLRGDEIDFVDISDLSQELCVKVAQGSVKN